MPVNGVSQLAAEAAAALLHNIKQQPQHLGIIEVAVMASAKFTAAAVEAEHPAVPTAQLTTCGSQHIAAAVSLFGQPSN